MFLPRNHSSALSVREIYKILEEQLKTPPWELENEELICQTLGGQRKRLEYIFLIMGLLQANTT